MEALFGIIALIGVGCILMGLRPGPWEIDHLEIEVAPPRPRRDRTVRIQAVARDLTDMYSSRTDRIVLAEVGRDAAGLGLSVPSGASETSSG
jgi:hypothetical protein